MSSKSASNDSTVIEMENDSTSSQPRLISMIKTEKLFGFHVRGYNTEGGPLRFYCGKLYAPLQHVSAVEAGSVAEKAGLRKGNHLLEVNGVKVDGAKHSRVADLIRASGDQLQLLVLHIPTTEEYLKAQSNIIFTKMEVQFGKHEAKFQAQIDELKRQNEDLKRQNSEIIALLSAQQQPENPPEYVFVEEVNEDDVEAIE